MIGWLEERRGGGNGRSGQFQTNPTSGFFDTAAHQARPAEIPRVSSAECAMCPLQESLSRMHIAEASRTPFAWGGAILSKNRFQISVTTSDSGKVRIRTIESSPKLPVVGSQSPSGRMRANILKDDFSQTVLRTGSSKALQQQAKLIASFHLRVCTTQETTCRRVSSISKILWCICGVSRWQEVSAHHGHFKRLWLIPGGSRWP